MNKCKLCNKRFNTINAVNAHMQVHSGKKKKKPKRVICKYCNNMFAINGIKHHEVKCVKKKNKCIYCNSETTNPKFCNKSCAATYNNKHRNGGSMTRKTKIKISNTLKEYFKDNPRKKQECVLIKKKTKKETKKEYIGICEVCGDEFTHDKKKKTCNNTCKNYLISIKRTQRIIDSGTTNFSTKQQPFSYKFVKNIKCDSKLEIAAIVYLVDIFKSDSIERFRSILNFWEDDMHRTFNPDFYVRKDNKRYIIEVKMKWSKNSDHDYNRTIHLKRKALKKYCDRYSYNMMWLDFDYDKKFMKIYRNVNKYIAQ